MRKAHIISIGNELLIGDTINTNASWLGGLLTEQGFYVEQVSTIPDDYDLIFEKAKDSLHKADITVVTGGLGPTHDDITKKVMVDLFETQLVENSEVLEFIKSIFKKRGFKFSRSNAAQASNSAGLMQLRHWFLKTAMFFLTIKEPRRECGSKKTETL